LTKATTGTTRGLIALALVAVTVLTVVAASVMVYRARNLTDDPFSLSNSGRPIPSEAERHEVVAVAEQFCLRVDGFDGDDPDGYRKQVTPMLTTKYKKSFETEFEAIQKLGVQKGQKGEGKVVVSGISDLDQDSATVLVVHDNAITSSTGTVQRHYRWTIDLAKVDGKWLIDDFTPVS
jgi:hypothetical protein